MSALPARAPALARAGTTRKARRPFRLGYTMIEVMASLGVLAIGASGIVALQKATLVGNTNARNLAAANGVAAAWVERLRADSVQWNDPGGTPNIGSTTWLKSALGVWFTPEEITNLASPDADILGADLFAGDNAAAAFCTQVRLTQLYPTLLRAEVRVFWERAGRPVTCPTAPADLESADAIGRYGFVYVTTGIHRNTLPE